MKETTMLKTQLHVLTRAIGLSRRVARALKLPRYGRVLVGAAYHAELETLFKLAEVELGLLREALGMPERPAPRRRSKARQ